MPPFLRSDKTLIKIAQGYINDGFVDTPDGRLALIDEFRYLRHSGFDVRRLMMIMTKLLKLNKAVDDVGNLQIRGDPVIRDIVGIEERKYRPGKPGTRNTAGSEYQKLLKEFEGMPFSAQAQVEALRPRDEKSPAGPSSFGTPRYIYINGRKRRLYKGLYGGIYYKNTYGTKIYLKPRINKNKTIKSADGISRLGWKTIVDWYKKSQHKISWVHELTRILTIKKIGDMIEFTVKTDDSGDMYYNYLEMIVSPDDDGNYPVIIDGKRYLVSGNSNDAKNTFSQVSSAPDIFNPGRSWYVYKFKTRIKLTEV